MAMIEGANKSEPVKLQLKAGIIKPEVFWEAFNLEGYFLLGGKMAYDLYPEKFANYVNTSPIQNKWSIEGSVNVGFNNLILRQATGQIPTTLYAIMTRVLIGLRIAIRVRMS